MTGPDLYKISLFTSLSVMCSKVELPEGRPEGRNPCSQHMGHTGSTLVPSRGGSENRQEPEWQQENRYESIAVIATESLCPRISAYTELP